MDVETLLKIVLVLVVVWIAIEILDLLTDVLLWLFKPLVAVAIVALIVLWLLDRI